MVRALASHQCVPGSIPGPGVTERFFSGYSGFPLSSKTNTSKFQFDLETVDEELPRGNAIIIIIILPGFDVFFTGTQC